MPYTPPKHRSPSSSTGSSPETSRRSSFHDVKLNPSHAPQPALPRSSSYLTRHRRTPSAVVPTVASLPTPEATFGLTSLVKDGQSARDDNNSRSVRQSPPPVTGDRRGMPTGAVFSPPESPCSNSDDDDEPAEKIRGRQIENINELRQLHEAISQLPQRRESSPSETSDTGVPMVRPLQAAASDGMRYSFSTSSLDALVRRGSSRSHSSSSSGNGANSGRRVSHVRSATEPALSITPPGGSSLTTSDEENDLEILNKPQMVRKKSGELVRPALRLGSRRRPSSMPGTPTFSKAVHFDSHLEHVRHFLQVDRPLAVSAGSSPVDTYDSETEYPFGSSPETGDQARRRTPPFEWEIVLTKFPVETPARKELPIRLERVWLSPDQKSLHGSVAVFNLAFNKAIACRFTLDYWKTTSEVAAEYSAEILPRVSPKGHDRFNFTIKLSDMANLESKTLYFCLRYNVNSEEFWDNNNGHNFQVDFKKKMLPINGKAGFQGSNGLPRSTRRANPSTSPRPVSMPASLDDFGDSGKVMFDKSIHDYLGEPVSSLRLKTSQSAIVLPSDNLSGRLTSPSGQAFANRYDFGASLSAAMLAGKDGVAPKRDGLFMKAGRGTATLPLSANPNRATVSSNASSAGSVNAMSGITAANTAKKQLPSAAATFPVSSLDRDSRAILSESATLYGPGSIASKSYDEIVSKYCFYVPNQPNQTKDGTLPIGQIDGSAGEIVKKRQSSPASSTSNGSPVQTLEHPPTALHHSIPRTDASTDAGWMPQQRQQQSLYQQQPRQSPTGSTVSSTSSASSTSIGPASPPSPVPLADAFSPFVAAASSEYSFQPMKDHFPFATTAATAIRG